jgi:hypothetical protein
VLHVNSFQDKVLAHTWGEQHTVESVIHVSLSDIEGLPRLDFDPTERSGRRQVRVRRIDECKVGDAGVDDEPLSPVLLGHSEEAAGGRSERPEFNQPTGGESGKKFAIPLALPVDRVGKGPI